MNKWKWSFFILLGIILATIIGLFVAIQVKPSDPIVLEKESEEERSSFAVQGTAEDFVSMGNAFLQNQYEEGKIDMPITLALQSGKIVTQLEIEAFGVRIPSELYFDAEALEDGSVLLSLDDLQIGRLNLPPETALQLFKKSPAVPAGIDIRPKEKEIHLAKETFNKGRTFDIHFQKVNLKEDEISFELILEE